MFSPQQSLGIFSSCFQEMSASAWYLPSISLEVPSLLSPPSFVACLPLKITPLYWFCESWLDLLKLSFKVLDCISVYGVSKSESGITSGLGYTAISQPYEPHMFHDSVSLSLEPWLIRRSSRQERRSGNQRSYLLLRRHPVWRL